MMHTKGPWRRGKVYQSVACDTSNGVIGNSASEVENYGGYLIAESIAPQNIPVITAGPEMLEALRVLRDADDDRKADDGLRFPPSIRMMINQAIAKAEGTLAHT